MDPSATSLEVREARVCYGAHCVLDRVSLSAAGGEFVALLGSSGCGKTTLLRAICGFVPVASGAISVGSRDITRLPPDKRNIAMVFQSYALWPHMTVAQNMAYGLKLRRVSRAEIAERIAALLAMLRLEGLGERRLGCPISRSLTACCVCLELRPLPSTALPGFLGTTSLSATPARPACPSRASG